MKRPRNEQELLADSYKYVSSIPQSEDRRVAIARAYRDGYRYALGDLIGAFNLSRVEVGALAPCERMQDDSDEDVCQACFSHPRVVSHPSTAPRLQAPQDTIEY